MLHAVILKNGRRIYKDEGSRLRCYDPESISYKMVELRDADGRLVPYEKNIDTDSSIVEVRGVRLTRSVGYAIGAAISRIYRINDEHTEGIVCFRSKEVQDEFFRIISPLVDRREVIRQAMRLSRRDEYWFKSRLTSSLFFGVLRDLGISPRASGKTWWMSKVPKDFKEGMAIGMIDARANFYIQDRTKYGFLPSFKMILSSASMAIHSQTYMIMSGVNVDVYETFRFARGTNINGVSIYLWSIVNNDKIFLSLKNKKLIGLIAEFMEKKNPRMRIYGNSAPMFIGLGKEYKSLTGNKQSSFIINKNHINRVNRTDAIEFIEKYNLKKSDNDKLRRWAELFKPDHRWSVVKSIEEHHTARY